MSVEMFDVLDKDGQPTGLQKTKNQILTDGDWRLVTHAWLFNDRASVLCQQRAVGTGKGLWDGLWDVTVGGGVAAGEMSRSACVRELGEEIGLEISPDDLISAGRFETTKLIPERGTTAREFSDTFILQREVAIASLVLQESEVAAVALVPIDKVGVNDNERSWVPHPPSYYDAVRQRCRELL